MLSKYLSVKLFVKVTSSRKLQKQPLLNSLIEVNPKSLEKHVARCLILMKSEINLINLSPLN